MHEMESWSNCYEKNKMGGSRGEGAERLTQAVKEKCKCEGGVRVESDKMGRC